MKYILLLVVLLSCREKKPPSHYHYTSIVIVGKDTIEYIDGTTNYTKVRHYSANGHNDTVSSTFFDTIWLKRPNDTVYIHDTIYQVILTVKDGVNDTTIIGQVTNRNPITPQQQNLTNE